MSLSGSTPSVCLDERRNTIARLGIHRRHDTIGMRDQIGNICGRIVLGRQSSHRCRPQTRCGRALACSSDVACMHNVSWCRRQRDRLVLPRSGCWRSLPGRDDGIGLIVPAHRIPSGRPTRQCGQQVLDDPLDCPFRQGEGIAGLMASMNQWMFRNWHRLW